MTSLPDRATDAALQGQRVVFVGKLAGMPKREAQQLVRRNGGVVAESVDAAVNLVIIGEEELPLADEAIEGSFDEAMRQRVERGTLEVIRETDLWQRLGLIDDQQSVRRLYTPAMLADLLGVDVSVIRRWHRRGLIVPREVRRLPYFDFQEVATARRLAELLSAGVSPAAIERKLAALARFLPSVERPLAQLSVIVEGKQLLLRRGDGLVDAGGQRRLDFGAEATHDLASSPLKFTPRPSAMPTTHDGEIHATTPAAMVLLAGEMEDEGLLDEAAEMYRTALVAGGPSAEISFLLAELLYRRGDTSAARERYYTAIELDEDYVEARANLGCVLAETGQRELAVAAFEGALAYHGDYADVHYHLARTLDDLQRRDAAQAHWRSFLELAPDSPWAHEAQARLEIS